MFSGFTASSACLFYKYVFTCLHVLVEVKEPFTPRALIVACWTSPWRWIWMHREPCLVQNHICATSSNLHSVCCKTSSNLYNVQMSCWVKCNTVIADRKRNEPSTKNIKKKIELSSNLLPPPLDHQTTPLCDPYLG